MAWAMIRWSEVSVCLAARFQRRLTSHELQVRKFCNHLVELHLLFGSKRSPSVLDLIIISILKPGKPAGSARVLICNRCHHKLIIFTRCKDTKKIWILSHFEPLFFNFCILRCMPALLCPVTFVNNQTSLFAFGLASVLYVYPPPTLGLRYAYATEVGKMCAFALGSSSVGYRLYLYTRSGQVGWHARTSWWSLLEVCIIFVEPSGFHLEGAIHTRVGVHRTRELGHSVTLERDVVDRLA